VTLFDGGKGVRNRADAAQYVLVEAQYRWCGATRLSDILIRTI